MTDHFDIDTLHTGEIPMYVLYRSQKEDYLKEFARDNTQLLLNKLWEVCHSIIVSYVTQFLFL